MTLVVASLPVRSEEDLNKVPLLSDADLVELRLDYLNNVAFPPLEKLRSLKERVIITIRDVNEGGVNYIDPVLKREYLLRLYEEGFFYDVEARFARKYNVPTNGKIVSLHYFDRVPLYEEVYEVIKDFIESSWIVKVAVIGNKGYKTLLSRLLELEKIAVMPMGVNPLERIAFSILGSKLVYGHVGEETARGQMHYKSLKQILSYLTTISISSPSVLT